mmetsp:Transcript_16851/g.34153  ORF Transcript_16851/g.34153 Transcript_16851/m.34153 type:complete len:190 (-) Transcript_16851:369-938(-)
MKIMFSSLLRSNIVFVVKVPRSNNGNHDRNNSHTTASCASALFLSRLSPPFEFRLIHFQHTNAMLLQLFSGVIRVSNVLEKFVSILSRNIKHNLGATWMVIQITCDVVHLWAPCFVVKSGKSYIRNIGTNQLRQKKIWDDLDEYFIIIAVYSFRIFENSEYWHCGSDLQIILAAIGKDAIEATSISSVM